jgi:hypothetical protein
MQKPTNPAYLGIAVTFAAAGLVFWLSGNGIGIAFLPIGITFLILAFQTPKPKAAGGRASSDGGAPVAGTTSGADGGRADGDGSPDPSPSPSSSGDGGSSDGGGGGGGD